MAVRRRDSHNGNTMPNTIPCPFCGKSGFRAVPFKDPEGHKTIRRETGYHWRCCTRCGNAFPSPAPNLHELQAYWNSIRVALPETSDHEAIWHDRYRAAELWANRTWAFMKPFLRSGTGRFLDVACGLGATVKLFQNQGWHAEGIDADPNTRAFHERLGIRTTIGQVEQLEFGNRFDFISIAHAIYFVTEPMAFIRRVPSLLLPEGLFLVVLSDVLSSHSDSKPAYVHTWYPTVESLVFVLEQEGFTVLRRSRITGSTLILATPSAAGVSKNSKMPVGKPLRTYLAHRSHGFRYFVLGRPRQFVATLAKHILRKTRDFGRR